MDRAALVQYLDAFLSVDQFTDFCPNGLQISGRDTIHHLVTGVTANLALIDAAIERNADALLVHHGFFWRGEDPCIVGLKYERIRRLIQHDISLFAYHLPLDAHSAVGNNVQLATELGLRVQGPLTDGHVPPLTLRGAFDQPLSGQQLETQLKQAVGRAPLYIEGRSEEIRTVAWCTGAAQDYIVVAVEAGCDAYITGEVSERTVDIARESGIHFYAAGHYATEQFGVQALGNQLADQFNLTHTFIPVPNPV